MHILGTRTGNNYYLYVNGSLVNSRLNITTSVYPHAAVRIGAAQGLSPSTNPFAAASNTDFYALRIYNRTLSATEVRDNYNYSKTRYGI
jgi:hypothetical protein